MKINFTVDDVTKEKQKLNTFEHVSHSTRGVGNLLTGSEIDFNEPGSIARSIGSADCSACCCT